MRPELARLPLPPLPLDQVRRGDVVYLPKRVSGVLTYDLPVTVTRVIECGGNHGRVICWDGGERLYTPDMIDTPAYREQAS